MRIRGIPANFPQRTLIITCAGMARAIKSPFGSIAALSQHLFEITL
jgi:hypothetical protein